jgi:hypothetical protein
MDTWIHGQNCHPYMQPKKMSEVIGWLNRVKVLDNVIAKNVMAVVL